MKRRKSVAPGHCQIENNDIEIRMSIGYAEPLRGALGQQHSDLRPQLPQQRSEAVPHDRVVINDQ
jgi:hypothetical protein